jgi:CheY-like chemotaxis protein
MPDLKKIVYIEDEPDIQMVAKLALEVVGGFEVMLCSSGQQALETLPVVLPDLILLDVMMPGMDGPSTLHALRDMPALKNTPVVFMTAKAQPAEIAQFLALGAIDVISKPFDPMTLAQTVRGIWQKYHGG